MKSKKGAQGIGIPAPRFGYCCYTVWCVLAAVFKDVLAAHLAAVHVFTASYDYLVEAALTCTCWYEVTADYVLLHALERVALTTYSSLVEHLGGLLEGCC